MLLLLWIGTDSIFFYGSFLKTTNCQSPIVLTQLVYPGGERSGSRFGPQSRSASSCLALPALTLCGVTVFFHPVLTVCDFLLACPAGARADTRLFPSLIVIPKRNSVFSVELNGFTSFIYGSKFEQRASERSAKKFKVRGTIDLWRFWRTVHLNIHPGGTTVMEVTSVGALSSQQSPVTSAMDATTGSTQSCHAHSCPFHVSYEHCCEMILPPAFCFVCIFVMFAVISLKATIDLFWSSLFGFD